LPLVSPGQKTSIPELELAPFSKHKTSTMNLVAVLSAALVGLIALADAADTASNGAHPVGFNPSTPVPVSVMGSSSEKRLRGEPFHPEPEPEPEPYGPYYPGQGSSDGDSTCSWDDDSTETNCGTLILVYGLVLVVLGCAAYICDRLKKEG
jgi:hypothetical protein